jgi:hypothetical protein
MFWLFRLNLTVATNNHACYKIIKIKEIIVQRITCRIFLLFSTRKIDMSNTSTWAAPDLK